MMQMKLINPYPQQSFTLEVNILLRFLRSTVLIIFIYILYDAICGRGFDNILKAVITAMVFVACYIWVIRSHGSRWSKYVSVGMIMTSITAGFFFQGGMFSVNGFDMFGLIIALIIIFTGRERIVFVALYLMIMTGMILTQLYRPEWVADLRSDDHVAMNVLEILMRIGNILYISFEYKLEFERERERVFEANKKLEEANAEVSAQNEVIASYSKRLEALVEERTKDIQMLNRKLIEYAFFNSHKVRGPLARILGLVYLVKLTRSSEDEFSPQTFNSHIEMLEKCANELDTVIKEITVILDKETKDLLDYNSALSTVSERAQQSCK
ncbi:cytochrome b/b6 domain-containing protein [Ohtaekwangia sp.]|uniref:cytochrome b/b6 domain-containing protein n=1 Tax=Ohtaekwangia sp. TaxID=2066019 RepID=UPI002FDCECF7